jgi:hypothetical protein
MPVLDTRDTRHHDLVEQLTADLGWLEEHARLQRDRPHLAGQLRMAAALVRNCLGPFLHGTMPPPLHVVVTGGAGAGKSTISNFLIGTAAAEANPQAGYTRHPIAYTSANGPLPWSQQLGFLATLRRLFDAQPSNIDDDVYQIRRVPANADTKDLLNRFVVWDSPDMTTWQATGYVNRLIEEIALADLVVYVASDERYNDLMPTQFLQLVLQAGKPVITCIMKMPEKLAQPIIDHFRTEVLAKIPECVHVTSCLAVPHLSREELADPVHKAARYRQPLIDKVHWYGERAPDTRKASIRGAMTYLTRFQDNLLSVARDDLAALQAWRNLVHSGRQEFEARYSKEYLSGEKFPRFDEALVRLLQLLELPGVGQLVSKALWAVRTPWRLAKGLLAKFTGKTASVIIPEEPVLASAWTAWLDLLRKEAARREDSHPLWDHVEKGFQSGLADQARNEFQRCLRDFQVGLASEVEATARAIYEELEKKPLALNTLRGSKFAIEVASIVGTILAGGVALHDIVLVPLVTSLTQELVELLGKQYVDLQREKARYRQQELLGRTLATPLAEWLTQWPATGGSSFERLQLALKRIPEGIKDLEQAVKSRLETVDGGR